MGRSMLHSASRESVWDLAERQHGVVARSQLLDLGFTRNAIEHRIGTGRLHPCGVVCTRSDGGR
jgi:hypothetical protein